MKYFKHLVFILGLALLASGISAVPSFAASPFNIGVIHDCKAVYNIQLLDNIKTEVISLTKGEFNVQFPSKFNIVSDCSEQKIKASIDRLLKDPEVDMILTLGALGSNLLGQYKNLSKPSIAGFILNPELQGIPFKNGKSGKQNLSYVVLSPNLEENINQFKQIATFKTAALLYDESIFQPIKLQKEFIQKLEKQTSTKLILVPVGREVEPVKEILDNTIEAAFIGHLIQLDSDSLSDLISYINNKKMPSFSFHDRELIKKGLLAGFDRTNEMDRFARRMAIFVQQVLLDEKPADFKVGFSRQGNLIINMKTAQSLNISPSFSLLTSAELINNDSLLTSELTTEKTKRDGIALSSLVTGGSNEMTTTAFGLNETQASISLLDAVNRALKNNLILKSREKETEAGKMNVKEALSKFYPQLGTGLNWTGIDEEHASAVSGVAERSWDISARVSQLLYSDQVYTNLKTSRHLQTAQELSEHQERLDVILETGLAYLNMLKARAIAIIQMDNLKLVRANLVLANNRYKSGFSGPSDVYRLESEAAIAYTTFLDALATVGKSRLRLNQILNLNLEDNTTIQDIQLNDGLFIVSDPKMRSILKINNPKDFRKFRDFIVKKGLEASPEIKALNEQIMIQKNAYGLASRSYWSPNVSLNGNIGNTFSKSGAGSDFNAATLPPSLASVINEPDDTHWMMSLNIDLPFYEGGAKSAQKIRARETKSQLMFFKYNIQNQISENIRAALYDLSASHPSIDLTRLSAESAKKNLNLVQDAYSNGAVSIVNFLDAQNAALVANIFAENAVYDFFSDFLITERAAGKYSLFMNNEERKQWLQEFQK